MDVASLLVLLTEDLLGIWFAAHLVDVLYYAGRLPATTSLVPAEWTVRDWFLGQSAATGSAGQRRDRKLQNRTHCILLRRKRKRRKKVDWEGPWV